ncbi:MAG: LTA synthase family protein, partial [Streptococcus sp.]
MKKMTRKLLNFMSTRLGFVLTLLCFYWLKTMWAYTVDFNLDIQGFYQAFLAFVNPIPLGLLFIGLALYFKRSTIFYGFSIFVYILLFIWLFSNAVYYREFSDFVTVNTMMASSSVSAGLGEAALGLFRPWDIIYLIDFPILGYLMYKKLIRVDHRPFNKRASFAITALSTMLFTANLFLAEIDRPQLLTRGFSNYYVVRALGLPAFLGYSGNQTYQANKERSKASAEDLKPVEEYIQNHYAEPNKDYFGIAKGRNVIYVHLESFQQFLIDYKLQADGKAYEVTPFLNSLYHSNSTLAFSNVFNQVKAGKTSDAETMIETGLFGLNQGSFMVNYGGTNTQQAAPFILSK